jgi:uncharacterized membrane protein YesL
MTGQGATAEAGEDNYVRLVLRQAWSGLPVLLAGSIISCLLGSVGALLSPGLTPIALLVFGLLVIPVVAGMMWFVRESIGPDAYGLARYLRTLPRYVARSVPVTVVPTATACIGLVALQVWERTGQVVWLVPLGLAVTTTVLAILGAVVAVPTKLAHPELEWRQLWFLSLAVVAASPVPVIAVVAVAVIGGWAAITISAGLLLLAPGLVALTWAAGALTASARVTVEVQPQEAAPA